MKKQQSGFSVIEGLIVLVIIGVLASVGWLVWKRQEKSTPPPGDANTNSAITVPGNRKTRTVSYTEKDTGFTFKAPAEWEKIEGRGLVVRFKAPNTDKSGTTSYQANIQVHSDDFSGTLTSFAKEQTASAKIPTAEVANIQVDQEVTGTTNGVEMASYEKTYTLTYDNTQVHCLTVLHVAKGKALDITACSLASKWDTYKENFMQGIIGYSY